MMFLHSVGPVVSVRTRPPYAGGRGEGNPPFALDSWVSLRDGMDNDLGGVDALPPAPSTEGSRTTASRASAGGDHVVAGGRAKASRARARRLQPAESHQAR